MNVYVVLLLQQLIASSTHLVGKSLTTDVDPRLVVLLRACFTVAAFSLWMYFNRRTLRQFDRSDLPRLLLLGLINIPINQLFFLSGLKHTTPPNASLLYALTPAFVFIIAVFFYKEKISRLKVLGIVAALAGTIVVLFERGIDFRSEFFFGNILVFAASVTWALYTVMGRPLILKYGAFHATALSMYAGFILYIPVFLLFPIETSVTDITPVHWFQLLYMGVVSSGIGYGLWYYALSRIEASKVAVFNNCQPILTTILAIIFFQQTPSLLFVVGGCVAIIGVFLTQKG